MGSASSVLFVGSELRGLCHDGNFLLGSARRQLEEFEVTRSDEIRDTKDRTHRL